MYITHTYRKEDGDGRGLERCLILNINFRFHYINVCILHTIKKIYEQQFFFFYHGSGI